MSVFANFVLMGLLQKADYSGLKKKIVDRINYCTSMLKIPANKRKKFLF